MKKVSKKNEQAFAIHNVISSFLKERAIVNGKENANLAIQVTENSIEIIEITDDGFHNWIEDVETINCL